MKNTTISMGMMLIMSVSVARAELPTEKTCRAAYSQASAAGLIMGHLRRACEPRPDPSTPACSALLDYVIDDAPAMAAAMAQAKECRGVFEAPDAIAAADKEAGRTARLINALTRILRAEL